MIADRLATARTFGWLGLRLTTSDRGTRKALGLIAAVSALICLVVAGTLGGQALVKQDAEIQAWRQVVGDRSRPASLDTEVWLTSGATYPTGSGKELTVLTIASQPGSRLDWPGIEVFPEPGTVMVSKGLTRVEGDVRRTIDQYVLLDNALETPTITLDDDFLRASDELLAVRFVATGGTGPPADSKPLQLGTVRQSAQTPNVVIFALLLVFFASATLLVTICARFLQHNQANVAAIRLQGVGALGVAAIILVPITLASLVGALTGASLYALITSLGSDLLSESIGFVLHRAAVSVQGWLVAVAGVVGVVALMGALSVALTRKSLTEIRGEERPQRAPVLRVVLLLPAAVLIASDTASDRGALLWWIGVGLVLVGVLALGRAVVAALSRRSWADPPQLLGFGILRGSTRETRLLYTPTVVVLFACALMVPLSSGLEYEDELSRVAYADLIVTDPVGGVGQLGRAQADLAKSDATWDVGLVANLSTEVTSADSSSNEVGLHSVWVGGCADLAQFFGSSQLPCKRGLAYFPDDLGPARTSQFAAKGSWRTHDVGPDLIYWANPNWPDTAGDEVALAWLAVSLNGSSVAEGISFIARRFPALHVEVPDEHRRTQQEAGQFMRALVLMAIAVVALAVLMTFTAAATNYLARRSVYLEHVLRLGLRKEALLVSALIAVVLPITVGGLLVLPTGIAIGSAFADGSTPTRYVLLAAATFLAAVCVGIVATTLRVVKLEIRAPQRTLGGAGIATRG